MQYTAIERVSRSATLRVDEDLRLARRYVVGSAVSMAFAYLLVAALAYHAVYAMGGLGH